MRCHASRPLGQFGIRIRRAFGSRVHGLRGKEAATLAERIKIDLKDASTTSRNLLSADAADRAVTHD
jgi:hypothetical protein